MNPSAVFIITLLAFVALSVLVPLLAYSLLYGWDKGVSLTVDAFTERSPDA